jgi:hypothetical protein
MFGGGIKIWIEPATANDSEMQFKYLELAAKHAAVTVNELRECAGLPMLDELEGQMVIPAPSPQVAANQDMDSRIFQGNGSRK